MFYCNIFYVFQYIRQSTDGLSLLMFWLAIFGNITYGLSILIRSVEPQWILKHLPWLIGSLGVVFLDISVSFLENCKSWLYNAMAKLITTHPSVLGPSWLWSYGSWIYNQGLSPLKLWVWIPPHSWRGNLRQVGGFLWVLYFPPPIKLTATIKLKYCW